MYALKRILAYAIDSAIMAVVVGFIHGFVSLMLTLVGLGAIHRFTGPYVSIAISVGVPVVIYGILTGLVGRTPGKAIMFLRVTDRAGNMIGISQGILREVIKAFALGFFIGMVIALFGIVTNQHAFYDDWLGCEVDDLKPSGLSDTQKNWRKIMRT